MPTCPFLKPVLYHIGLLCLLAGCNLMWTPVEDASPDLYLPTLTPAATSTPAPTLIPPTASAADGMYVPLSLPDGLQDELPLMSGICFEAALDAVDEVFVLHNALEHIRFYDLADRSRLCRQPVTRYPFDFDTGRILAGVWSAGSGCEAQHELLAYERDAERKTILLRLRFTTSGTCPYELVRPFWVSIPDAKDYQVTIEVE